MPGQPFGVHRVLEPRGALPQAAWRLDNDTAKQYANEIVLDVERLNIDSASFAQMQAAGEGAAGVVHLITETVRTRGKQHNPVTGSGGMLLGRVARVGSALAVDLAAGERVATLVSLTLTPLRLDAIDAVDRARHQVACRGQAILFGPAGWARLPADLPEAMALAAFDVAGAAPQIARLVTSGARVLVLGCGGNSGLLACAAARRAGAALLVGVESSVAAASDARRLGACDQVVMADCADALATLAALERAGAIGFDLTVSCVNAADTEMAAILATRERGVVYFFSMGTSFTKAALGAEGVSRDLTMLIGCGYSPGHAEATLALLRTDARLREIFVARYGV